MNDEWATELQPAAPDIVAAWTGIQAERFISVRREVRREFRQHVEHVVLGESPELQHVKPPEPVDHAADRA